MGSVLAVKFSQQNQVILYKNNPEAIKEYEPNMRVYCEDINSYISGKNIKITSNLKKMVDKVDLIFVTFPAFLFKTLSEELFPLVRSGQHLFFVPGSGGAELYFKDFINKGVTISGLQRVHSVARIIEMGKLTKESGIRKELKVASVPNSYNDEACKIISELYSLPVQRLDNYLNITLINSNPILHTARLYSIFKDYDISKKEYNSVPLFYEEWDLESSKLLVEMDQELFKMLNLLESKGLPVKQIVPLLEHYESVDPEGLTRKLNSIYSLKGLKTPFVINERGKFLPDLNSRYFTADFPYGLDILISFAKLLGTKCDHMIQVSNWYHSIDKRITHYFNLRDFGIDSSDDILNFYK